MEFSFYGSLWTQTQNMFMAPTSLQMTNSCMSDSANCTPVRFVRVNDLHTRTSSNAVILPDLQTSWTVVSKTKARLNHERSTRPSRFGSSTHTSSLISDVSQAGQAAGQFGQPAVGEQLMNGCGFGDSSCGDHRHSPEHSTAAGADRAQNRILRLTTERL